ncbi:sensor histidine kinase [Amycolatopsis sp. CA-230715]|uniref:sensor histidine kinase n=1 Tax=Amycolatopsis sp. CA-230715 TaxID=2745196 RepID=UPI001C00B872|nr:histidine kinase [Amycolatopsis sp. CA-230715]
MAAGKRRFSLDAGWLVPVPDAPGEGGRHARRTALDWLGDVTTFVVSVLFGLALLVVAVRVGGVQLSGPLFYSDLVVGGVACLSLFLRRRWPLWVAVATATATTVSTVAVAPALIAVFTVAGVAPAGIALAVAALNAAGTTIYYVLLPGLSKYWDGVVPALGLLLAALAWGMMVRARRQLIVSLRQRAERAEAEQRLLADQARQAERSRIAREMHDVLAHRVSLIALHAGGLEIRSDLPPEQVRTTAALIRTSARQTLVELGDVIGVLRVAQGAEAPLSKQRTLSDIPTLVEESTAAGADVDLTFEVERADEAPGQLARAAYRAVQESLTNVTKHAPGAPAAVSVTGGPGTGLRVTVRNPLRPGEPGDTPALPGSGTGLVGLAERVSLVGGTLSHGQTPNGEFLVDARLEWSE